jgi:hypothetical protein
MVCPHATTKRTIGVKGNDRQYGRLAWKVDWRELKEQLSARLQHDDADVQRRARWVMDACEKPRKQSLRNGT